jgi:cell wall assembly regulator SMI1
MVTSLAEKHTTISEMKETWARLERWANQHGASLRLRPGAPEKEIAAAEEKMNLRFPDDLRASIAAHDGQEDADDCFAFLPGCDLLKPLAAVVAQWEEEVGLADPSEEIVASEDGLLHTVLWHPKRIPIAGNYFWDGGNTYCDLFPGPKGTSGQIVTFVSECDLVALGASLKNALELYLGALESGEWIFDKHITPPRGRVHHKDEGQDEYPNVSYEFSQWIKTKMC